MCKKLENHSLATIFIAILIIAGCSIPLQAGPPNNNEAKEIPLHNTQIGSAGRPKSPQLECIVCYYAHGKLYLNFAYAMGQCQLKVTDFSTGITNEYSIDSSLINCELTIGETTNALIEITTSNGKSYQEILAV